MSRTRHLKHTLRSFCKTGASINILCSGKEACLVSVDCWKFVHCALLVMPFNFLASVHNLQYIMFVHSSKASQLNSFYHSVCYFLAFLERFSLCGSSLETVVLVVVEDAFESLWKKKRIKSAGLRFCVFALDPFSLRHLQCKFLLLHRLPLDSLLTTNFIGSKQLIIRLLRAVQFWRNTVFTYILPRTESAIITNTISDGLVTWKKHASFGCTYS